MTAAQDERPPKWRADWPRINRASNKARRLYPHCVASLVIKELEVWAEFGYLLGGHRTVYDLLDHLEKAPLPPPAEPNVVHRAEVE
jgi:hypothetical protein